MSDQQSEPEEAPRFLLLLPPLPAQDDTQVITSIYGTTIRDVLKESTQASAEYTSAPLLEIALLFPERKPDDTTSQYEQTQSYLARAYSLVCTIAAQNLYNIEDKDGVDVRIILVSDQSHSSGLAIPLPQFAGAGRPWQYAFGVEDDAGTALVKSFVQAKQSQGHAHSHEHGQACNHDHDHEHHHHPHTSEPSQPLSEAQRIPCVAVGGTFDHLHVGHKLLLSMTLSAALDQPSDAGRTVIVGITGDELLKNKKYVEHLDSWDVRQAAVLDFIRTLVDFDEDGTEPVLEHVNEPGPNGKAVNATFSNGLTIRCVEINDAFGPTITEEDIDTLIISGETRSGGKAVNNKRTEKGWKPLTVLEVDVLQASESVKQAQADDSKTQDFADKISSTAIRKRLSEKS